MNRSAIQENLYGLPTSASFTWVIKQYPDCGRFTSALPKVVLCDPALRLWSEDCLLAEVALCQTEDGWEGNSEMKAGFISKVELLSSGQIVWTALEEELHIKQHIPIEVFVKMRVG